MMNGYEDSNCDIQSVEEVLKEHVYESTVSANVELVPRRPLWMRK